MLADQVPNSVFIAGAANDARRSHRKLSFSDYLYLDKLLEDGGSMEAGRLNLPDTLLLDALNCEPGSGASRSATASAEGLLEIPDLLRDWDGCGKWAGGGTTQASANSDSGANRSCICTRAMRDNLRCRLQQQQQHCVSEVPHHANLQQLSMHAAALHQLQP